MATKLSKTHFQALGAIEVSEEEGLIKGVSVISIGPALGHGVQVDEEGLKQCLAACEAKGEQGVKLVADHGSGFFDIVGAVKNFRIEGDKLLGDAHLLDNAPNRAFILEIASKLSGNFGLSVETWGEHEDQGEEKPQLFRCEEIDAIALVPNPAANKTGLFQRGEKQLSKTKMDEEEIKEIVAEGVAEALEPIEERLSKLENKEPEEKDEDELDEGEGEKDEERLSKLAAKAAEKAVTKLASRIGISRAPKQVDNSHSSSRKLSRFEQKVEEAVAAGKANPRAYAVMRYPDLYNEHRISLEKGGQ